MRLFFNIILLASLLFSCGNALTSYQQGAKVDVFVNKVGPYFNPHETYHYYSLPVCCPDKIEHKSLTLGEVLDGDRMAYSMYDIKFQENLQSQTLCTLTMNEKELDQMREAIEELYYSEMVIDDLPVRSFIGRFEESSSIFAVPHVHKFFLHNHIIFHFKYNKDKVFFNCNFSNINITKFNKFNDKKINDSMDLMIYSEINYKTSLL